MCASGRLGALQSRFIGSLAAAAPTGRSFHLNRKLVSTQGPTPTTYALPDLNAEIKTSHVVVVQEFRGCAL